MKNRFNFLYGFVALLLFSFLACEQKYPPLAATEEVTVPYTIVSVDQPTGAAEAIIEVKLPNVGTGNFEVELLAKDGSVIPLKPGTDAVVANFKLRPYTASALVSGTQYTAKLTYRDSRDNEIKAERNFTAHAPDTWKKLPPIISTPGKIPTQSISAKRARDW